MAEWVTAAEALAEYHRLQGLEGATLASEHSLAEACGRAWAGYLRACDREGLRPVSMENPNLGRL